MALDKVVDSEQLDAGLKMIGDQMREKTGSNETFAFPDGMAAGVSQVYEAGESAERAKCVAKHFVTTILGNGETSISFRVPFKPDFMTVICSDSDVFSNANNIIYAVMLDISTFGFIAGTEYVSASGGMKGQQMTSTSIYKRYSQASDGTVTLQNIGSTVGKFFSGRSYTVVAVRYVEKSDKERITEYIRSLGDSGSTTLNQAKVEAAFTDEEWAALIAEKPGWTFSFV